MVTLKCSVCGTRVRRSSKVEALKAMRKHWWSKHRASMIRRIKAGKRKKSNPNAKGFTEEQLKKAGFLDADPEKIKKWAELIAFLIMQVR